MADFFEVGADGVAVGALVTLPEGQAIEDCFPADSVDRFKPAAPNMRAGWRWDGSAFVKPTPVIEKSVVPEEISRSQFYRQLTIDGGVTEDEALDAAAGIAIPKKIAEEVAALPKSQQFSAKMLLRTASSFQRSHPVLGDVLKKGDAALDAFWTAAATL